MRSQKSRHERRLRSVKNRSSSVSLEGLDRIKRASVRSAKPVTAVPTEVAVAPMVAVAPERTVTVPSRPRLAPTVSVIIPTLNEAGNFPYVLNTLPGWVHEVIVVDGLSRDDTERVAKVLRPDVRIIRQTTKGKGAAMRAGLQAATGDILIAMDADGSMDGAAIEAIREALINGADYVKGSRFCEGAGSADITRIRRLGDMGICWMIRILFGAKYSDVTYGFIGLWANKLSSIDIDSDGFEVETLIGIRAHRAGLKTVEVPCFESNRIYGTSNLSATRDGLRILRVILRERLRRYHAPTV
jgi:glycosyltransferase involved in cell wall biosynthesis